MRYHFHDGIVYTKICNVSLLVATRKVWDKFPAVKEISPLQGALCKGIELGMNEEELLNYLIKLKKAKPEFIKKRYHIFLENMLKYGYLIAENDGNE